MRLIGTFSTEKEAYALYCALLKQGIENLYESAVDATTNNRVYHVWVYDEERLEESSALLEEYRKNPEAEKFQSPIPKVAIPPTSPAYEEVTQREDLKWQSVPPAPMRRRRFAWGLMHFVILLCTILFFWNDAEEAHLEDAKGPLAPQIAMTPLQQTFLFDDPSSYSYIQKLIDTVPIKEVRDLKELPPEAVALLDRSETAPSWRGLYSFLVIAKEKGFSIAKEAPLFEKIRQGELWRLFTPCLLHRDFLHILFNMIWAWMLLKQLDARLPKWKVFFLIVLIGCVSNVAQYLAGGPYFLGFSGVVVGLAGFIWQRQRRAPWEGYPLQRATVSFLLFFVLAMFALEILSFFIQMISPIQLFPQIANTAHVVGGLMGLLLGRFQFFSRRSA